MDKHPFELETPSTLPTRPPTVTTPTYRRFPPRLGQYGRSMSYTSIGESFRATTKPSQQQLAAWDEARQREPVIKASFNVILRHLLASLGEYVHPDREIQNFVRANIQFNLPRWIEAAAVSSLWSGFSVAETIWQYREGPNGRQVWIEDLMPYHPIQVFFIVNDFGRLTHGEKVTYSSYKSGVWVPRPSSQYVKKINTDTHGVHARLPKSKTFYTKIGHDQNNPYGQSSLFPVMRYQLFKEVFMDLMSNALDRYAMPLLYVKVPNQTTQESIEEPDGSTRLLTLQEVVAREIQEIEHDSFLVFTQNDAKNAPIEVGSLTTGNNYGSAFSEAIELCDKNMMMGLNIPNLLFHDKSSHLGSTNASGIQWEVFNYFVGSLYDMIVGTFVDQVVRQLIQFNFDARQVPEAGEVGYIQRKPIRPVDQKVASEVYATLTQIGALNTNNDLDFAHIRSVMGLPEREREMYDQPILKGIPVGPGIASNVLANAAGNHAAEGAYNDQQDGD